MARCLDYLSDALVLQVRRRRSRLLLKGGSYGVLAWLGEGVGGGPVINVAGGRRLIEQDEVLLLLLLLLWGLLRLLLLRWLRGMCRQARRTGGKP